MEVGEGFEFKNKQNHSKKDDVKCEGEKKKMQDDKVSNEKIFALQTV